MEQKFLNDNSELFEEFNKELSEQYKKLYAEAGLVYTSESESETEQSEESRSESDSDSESGSESESEDSSDELMNIASTAISNIINKFYTDKRYKDITNILFYSVYDTTVDLLEFVTDAIIELKLKMPDSEVTRFDEIKEYLNKNSHKNEEFEDMVDIFRHFRKDYKKI